MVYEVRLWQLFREADNAAKAAPPPTTTTTTFRLLFVKLSAKSVLDE